MTTIKTNNIEFDSGRRVSAHQDQIDALADLEPGQSVWIPFEGEDHANIHATLGHLLRKYAPKPPRGWRWTKRTGTRKDGSRGISIHLVKAKAPGRAASWAFGAVE